MQDLFETPELIPDKVKALLGYHTDELEYEELQHLQHDCELLGYTFDFDLHCEVGNLRVKSSLDYIIDKSGVTSPEDKELLRSAYNALHKDDREMVDEMFLYKGFVYYTTHEHRTKDHTFTIDCGDLALFGETHEEIQDLINTYLLTIPNN